MGAKSRRKGAVGELEWAKFLTARGFPSRRGQQYNGLEGEDVKTEGLDELVHWEVKRTEALSLYAALDQAIADAGTRIPLIAHRRNKKQWLVILRGTDLLQLAEVIHTLASHGPGGGDEAGTLSEPSNISSPPNQPVSRARVGAHPMPRERGRIGRDGVDGSRSS